MRPASGVCSPSSASALPSPSASSVAVTSSAGLSLSPPPPSSPGDLPGTIKKLRSALRRLRYPPALQHPLLQRTSGTYSPGLSDECLSRGDVTEFLAIFHFLCLQLSEGVWRAFQDRGYDLLYKTDQRFVQTLWKFLRDECNYRPALTVSQFLSPTGFAERKIHLCLDLIHICRQIHNNHAAQHHPRRPRSSQSPPLSAGALVSRGDSEDENKCPGARGTRGSLQASVASSHSAHSLTPKGRNDIHEPVLAPRPGKSADYFLRSPSRGRTGPVAASGKHKESRQFKDADNVSMSAPLTNGWQPSPWSASGHPGGPRRDDKVDSAPQNSDTSAVSSRVGGANGLAATKGCAETFPGCVGLAGEATFRGWGGLQGQAGGEIAMSAQVLHVLMEQVSNLSSKVGAFSEHVASSIDELHLQLQLLQTRVSIVESRLAFSITDSAPKAPATASPASPQTSEDFLHATASSSRSRTATFADGGKPTAPSGASPPVSSPVASFQPQAAAAPSWQPGRGGVPVNEPTAPARPLVEARGQACASVSQEQPAARPEAARVLSVQMPSRRLASPCDTRLECLADQPAGSPSEGRRQGEHACDEGSADSRPAAASHWQAQEDGTSPQTEARFFASEETEFLATTSAPEKWGLEKGEGSAPTQGLLDPLDVEMQQNVLRITEKLNSLQAVLRRSTRKADCAPVSYSSAAVGAPSVRTPLGARSPSHVGAYGPVSGDTGSSSVCCGSAIFASDLDSSGPILPGYGAAAPRRSADAFRILQRSSPLTPAAQDRGPDSGSPAGGAEASSPVDTPYHAEEWTCSFSKTSGSTEENRGMVTDAPGLPSFAAQAMGSDRGTGQGVRVSKKASAAPRGTVGDSCSPASDGGKARGAERAEGMERILTSHCSEPAERGHQSQQTPFFGLSCSSDGAGSELLDSSTASASKATPPYRLPQDLGSSSDLRGVFSPGK
ncbi:hypothetical protein BESB_074770 [Besnoitia besnoiti]|uniref:Centrosomal protein of 44 kDa n=1 Tax=Besnoitia besnoiti TaxID=94643 RepID=A0A2A9M8L7_BESBE|nr:uncharacterized protein BESB_074770 [Besnoitia besnoiti]PFH34325.1 hypothetical protein BESB_074770 [Besnoitia besnoiti]